MNPLCITNGEITQGQLITLDTVRRIVAQLPDGLTSHRICEIIARELPYVLDHYRGKFNGYDHSWLVFKRHSGVILDPCPLAAASGCLLVMTMGPWENLYIGEMVRPL